MRSRSPCPNLSSWTCRAAPGGGDSGDVAHRLPAALPRRQRQGGRHRPHPRVRQRRWHRRDAAGGAPRPEGDRHGGCGGEARALPRARRVGRVQLQGGGRLQAAGARRDRRPRRRRRARLRRRLARRVECGRPRDGRALGGVRLDGRRGGAVGRADPRAAAAEARRCSRRRCAAGASSTRRSSPGASPSTRCRSLHRATTRRSSTPSRSRSTTRRRRTSIWRRTLLSIGKVTLLVESAEVCEASG